MSDGVMLATTMVGKVNKMDSVIHQVARNQLFQTIEDSGRRMGEAMEAKVRACLGREVERYYTSESVLLDKFENDVIETTNTTLILLNQDRFGWFYIIDEEDVGREWRQCRTHEGHLSVGRLSPLGVMTQVGLKSATVLTDVDQLVHTEDRLYEPPAEMRTSSYGPRSEIFNQIVQRARDHMLDKLNKEPVVAISPSSSDGGDDIAIDIQLEFGPLPPSKRENLKNTYCFSLFQRALYLTTTIKITPKVVSTAATTI